MFSFLNNYLNILLFSQKASISVLIQSCSQHLPFIFCHYALFNQILGLYKHGKTLELNCANNIRVALVWALSISSLFPYLTWTIAVFSIFWKVLYKCCLRKGAPATPLARKLLLHWNARAVADLRNHMSDFHILQKTVVVQPAVAAGSGISDPWLVDGHSFYHISQLH